MFLAFESAMAMDPRKKTLVIIDLGAVTKFNVMDEQVSLKYKNNLSTFGFVHLYSPRFKPMLNSSKVNVLNTCCSL